MGGGGRSALDCDSGLRVADQAGGRQWRQKGWVGRHCKGLVGNNKDQTRRERPSGLLRTLREVLIPKGLLFMLNQGRGD